MKYYVTSFICVLFLAACSEKPEGKTETRRTLYYKQGVSDTQMTEDLNDCAYKTLKSSIASENARSKTEILSKKTCMLSKGYDLFYH